MFHKIDYEKSTKKLLEDKYFMIIHGTNPQGALIADMEGHHNEWLTHDEVHAKEKVFESIVEAAEIAKAEGYEFVEKEYFYDTEEY